MRIFYLIAVLLFVIAAHLEANEPDKGEEKETHAHLSGTIQCDGQNLPFINVFLKGTTRGTVSNEDGSFTLKHLPIGKVTIVASAIGYKSQEIEINTERNKTFSLNFELEEDVLGLEEVVVTAGRNETRKSDALLVVNTLDPELLENSGAISIAEGLDFTPGLRMECNCQNCGFSQVRMNGLEGPYSQILINSRPVFSGLAGVYGLELFPTNMVEQIEVVRGGGSSLYGGNAIAGTINIITKEPGYNSFSFDSEVGITGIGESDPAMDKLMRFSGSVVTKDYKSSLFIYGLTRNRDFYDENGDDFSEIVQLENTTLGISAYHKPGKLSKVSMDLYRINEFRRGGNKFDYLPHEADIAEQVNHIITGGSLAYDVYMNEMSKNKLSMYASAQEVDRDSYYGAMQDKDAYGRTFDFTSSFGGMFSYNLDKLIFAPSTLVFGVDDNFNTLKDTKLGSNENPNVTLAHQYVNTLGTFIQNDWHIEETKIGLGLRYDKYLIRDLNRGANEDIAGDVLIPRLNFLFHLNHFLQYRISYAMGYRAPQLFDEDLHIEASGSRRILHRNAEDLSQETSQTITSSFSLNGKIGKSENELLLEGFYTKLNNPFANEYNQLDEDGTYEYVRVNANDGAFVAGTNIELNSAFSKKIKMQASLTMQVSKYETKQIWGDVEKYPEHTTRDFLRSPNSYGFLSLDWEPSKRFIASINSTYTGSMKVPHFGGQITSDQELNDLLASNDHEVYEYAVAMNQAIQNGEIIEGERLETSEQFLHLGCRLAYKFNLSKETKLQLSLGIKNIFNQMQNNYDVGVFRDAGYIYGPCQPRTINVGVKIGNIL